MNLGHGSINVFSLYLDSPNSNDIFFKFKLYGIGNFGIRNICMHVGFVVIMLEMPTQVDHGSTAKAMSATHGLLTFQAMS